MLLFLLACAGSPQPPVAGDTDTSPDTDGSTWRSALYPEDWAPGFSVESSFLHDFSYAGYHNSESPLPDTLPSTRFDVADYGADATGGSDSTAAIQAAIDDAADAGGGLVALGAGTYRVDGTLLVSASGTVISGAGPETVLVFTRAGNISDVYHLSFRGTLTEGDDNPLTAEAGAWDTTLAIEDASALSVGDDVHVGWVITDEFVEEHGMTGTWQAFNGTWRPFFRRTVTGIDAEAGTVTVDVPLRYPAQLRDQPSLRRAEGYLSECGLQDLSVSTTATWEDAWSSDRSHAIGMVGVKDCWIQRVQSAPSAVVDAPYHLQSSGIIVRDAKRVTVAESTMELAQNRGGGGNGYLFEVMRSSEVLIRDSTGRAGRHNFIQNWDFGTSGCVFLRTTSTEGGLIYDEGSTEPYWVGASEFHHSLAMANLIDDSLTDDGWGAVNRRSYSSGAGHSATQNVFWNVQGAGTLTSFQYGLGYVVGTGPELVVEVAVSDLNDSAGTAPEDHTEGLGEAATLQPGSLFDDQLARRLARGERLWAAQ